MQTPARINKAIFFFLLWYFISSVLLGVILAPFEPSLVVLIGLGQVVGLFVPFLFYLLITKQSFKQVLPCEKLTGKNTLLTVIFSFAMLPVLHLVSNLLSFLFVPMIGDVIGPADQSPMWLMLIVVGVFPSLFEEFWFRGAMYTEYRAGKVPILKIAIVTAFFFGFFHANFQQSLYAAFLGVFYAYIVHYTRSIWSVILAHFINNGSSVVLMYIGSYQEWLAGQTQTVMLLILVIVSAFMVPVLIICLKQFKKHYDTTKTTDEFTTEAETQVAADQDRVQILDEQIGDHVSVNVSIEEVNVDIRKPKVLTWGFLAALILVLIMNILMEIVLRFS